jgi:nicotinamide phosphoribosyltransferase
MFNTNLILDTDSYKFSHHSQYPPGMTYNYSYFESRGGEYPYTVFFGLQYYLKEYLSRPVSETQVKEAAELAKLHGEPFNYDGWMKIVKKHNGYLPIRIKAVPEGTVVPTRNVLMTIESTDPESAWVTSFIETMLVRVWYPTTVATRSWDAKRTIKHYLDKTSDNPETEIGFKLHDFGSRGSTSAESAAIGGASHLINFMGTDTVISLPFIRKYYNTDSIVGFSIPAAEHSTITAWGKDGEVDAYRNMIKQYGDGIMFACVSDSYDIYNAVENIWGGVLKQEVMDMNAVLVVRPDSGDPVQVVSNVVRMLADKFGYTINSKGFKVLNKVRVIQGDGMNPEQIKKVYKELHDSLYSADNLAVGMGGGLLQSVNRDTCKFAYKTSYMEINGEGVDIWKDPVTDTGKRSKKGRLSLIRNKGVLETVPYNETEDVLETVWVNGRLLKEHTFEEIRARSEEKIIKI